MAQMMVVPLTEIDNYIIGKTEQIWGARKNNKEVADLTIGDELIFVIGVHSLDEPTPKGFPRLKSYSGLDVQVEELWRCKLKTTPIHRDDSPFGADFPVVFEFEMLGSFHDFPINSLKPEVVEGIRKIFTGKKKLVSINNDHFADLFKKPKLSA